MKSDSVSKGSDLNFPQFLELNFQFLRKNCLEVSSCSIFEIVLKYY